MIKRIKAIYFEKTNTVTGKSLSVREWVKQKISENLENLISKDDFSSVFCINREKGIYVVYAHSHRDVQKALKNLIETFNNGERHE